MTRESLVLLGVSVRWARRERREILVHRVTRDPSDPLVLRVSVA